MRNSPANNSAYSATKIGIISDTHGLLRAEAVAALRGVELIIHCGDIGGHAGDVGGQAGDAGGHAGEDGKAEILRALAEVAPVVAVRGNVDTEEWGMNLPETLSVETEPRTSRYGARYHAVRGGAGVVETAGSVEKPAQPGMAVPLKAEPVLIYVLHNLKELDIDPVAAGFHMVVSGHTHEPVKSERGGVIYLNPGSAGPRRFKLPVSLARVDLGVRPWGIEIVELGGRGK